MTKSAGAVQNGLVLRLSMPASGDLSAVGPEMAVKLAEQLGLAAPHAARLADTITDLARTVGADATEVSFEFTKADAELRIEARQGSRASEARVPLNA